MDLTFESQEREKNQVEDETRDKADDFLCDQAGLTTVEYAVAGALVAAAIVLAFTSLGTAVGQVLVGMKTAILS